MWQHLRSRRELENLDGSMLRDRLSPWRSEVRGAKAIVDDRIDRSRGRLFDERSLSAAYLLAGSKALIFRWRRRSQAVLAVRPDSSVPHHLEPVGPSEGYAAVQQIADWLEKLGMSEYAQRFAENGIDIAALPYLTDQDLKDIGVLLGHRRKMLAAIDDELEPGAKGTAASALTSAAPSIAAASPGQSPKMSASAGMSR